jgi:hypothetical protein
MRSATLLAVLTVAVPIGLWAGSASAQFFKGQSVVFGRYHVYQGAWCGHQDTGGQNVEEDCSFDSFEHCRWAVMGVNNAFCTPNPAFTGYPVRAHKKKHHRHARY